MRLTVRTLLAWMDGTLEAADREALGDKVAASGVAPQLVERIRGVMAKPGVSVPSPSGRGLADDPNTTAAFLDNALEPELLETFERICVESDAHLADIAGTHQLLAELARDPAAGRLSGPERSRALLEAARRRLDPAAARVAGDRGGGTPTGTASTPMATSPRTPRRAPLAAWLAAAAALALLLTLGGFLAWSIGRGGRLGTPREVTAVPPNDRRPEPAAPQAPPPDVAAASREAAEPRDAGVSPATEPPAAASVVTPAPAPAPTPAPAPAPAFAAQPAIPAEPPATNSPPPAPPAPSWQPPPAVARVPSGDAMAIVAAPAPAAAVAGGTSPAGLPGPDTPPAGAAPPPAPARSAAAPRPPLLHRVTVDGRTAWLPLAADAVLAAREDLLAPPWCHPTVAIDGIDVRLEPCTRAVVTRDDDGTPRIEILFGRAVVAAAAADARVGVTAGGLTGVVSGMMRQPFGIEAGFDRDPGVASTAVRHAAVHAGGGEKIWRQTVAAGGAEAALAGLPPEVLLAARGTIAWDSRDPAAARLLPPADVPWLGPVAEGDRVERSAARALAAAVAVDPDAGVDGPLRRLAADRRGENRMIATACLALLGEYGELAALLCAEPPLALGETQWTELERMTVPLALARGDNAAAALTAALRAAAPAGAGDVLVALAHGFADDELAQGGDALLVESLGADSLAVRRYAIRRLQEIRPPDERHRGIYRADRAPLSRQDGAAWWKAQLEQGLLRRPGVVPDPPAPTRPARPTRDDE